MHHLNLTRAFPFHNSTVFFLGHLHVSILYRVGETEKDRERELGKGVESTLPPLKEPIHDRPSCILLVFTTVQGFF